MSTTLPTSEGPTFLRSIAWMLLTLSLLTVSIGGLFWKADLAHPESSLAASSQVR